MNIREFRQQYPQYDDISDLELSRKLHAKNYSDMRFDDFAERFGVGVNLPQPSQESVEQVRQALAKPRAERVSDIQIPLEVTRSEEFKGAVSRGIARVGAAGLQAAARIRGAETPPGAWALPDTSEQRKAKKAAAEKLRESADLLWKVSQDPEIAAVNKDLGSKALSLIGETIPYATATTTGVLAAGPVGGFAVGSLVEGNSAYRTALDAGVPEDQAKKIGVGVGLVSGAIEALGGRGAEILATRAAGKIKSKLARTGAVFAAGTVIEALEEAGQEVAAITGEETYRDVNWNERVSRVLSSMAGGAFLGGAAKTAGVAGRGFLSATGLEAAPRMEPAIGPGEIISAQPDIMTGEKAVSTIPEAEQEIRPAEDVELEQAIEAAQEIQLIPSAQSDLIIGPEAVYEIVNMAEELGTSGEYILGSIRTEIEAPKIISRFPQKITDQKSLEELGNAISEHMGVKGQWNIRWELYDRKKGTKESLGTSTIRRLPSGSKPGFAKVRIAKPSGELISTRAHKPSRVRAGHKGRKEGGALRHTQGETKKTIVHELGHLMNHEYYGTLKQAHSPKFAKWVNEKVGELFAERPGKVVPVSETDISQTIPSAYPIKSAQPEQITGEVAAQSLATTPIEAQKQLEVSGKPRVSRKRLLRATVKKIAREGELEDKEYRDLLQSVTGKRSMKSMKVKELETLVAEMETRYGAPEPLTEADYEMPIQLGDKQTTVGSMMRNVKAAIEDLEPRTVGTLRKIGQFIAGTDNTPVYYLAEVLDKGREGIFSDIFTKNMARAARVEAAFARENDAYLLKTLEDAGVSTDDLAKMSKVLNPRHALMQSLGKFATDAVEITAGGEKVSVTWGQLFDFYMATKNGDGSGVRHTLGGGWYINGKWTGAWSEQEMVDVQAMCEANPKFMASVNAVRALQKDHWSLAVNNVSNQLEGKDIATVEDWWGLEVWSVRGLAGKGKPTSSDRSPGINMIENRSIWRDRTKSNAPLVMRDGFNRYAIFRDAIAEYVGFAEPLRTARTVLNDKNVKAALDQKGYIDIHNKIVSIYDRAQGSAIGTGDALSPWMSKYMPGVYRGLLVTNPRVLASQTTSVFCYGAYVSPDVMAHVLANTDIIQDTRDTLDLSDIAWSRFHRNLSSLELGEMSHNDAALKAFTGKTSDINLLGYGLKYSDIITIARGMRATWKEYELHRTGKLKGLSAMWWAEHPTDLPEMNAKLWREIEAKGESATAEEREAVNMWRGLITRRAEYLWQRSQPSWDKWNRSKKTSQRGLGRMVFLFRSFHEKALTVVNEAVLKYENSSKSPEDKAYFVQRISSVMTSYAVNVIFRATLVAVAAGKLPDVYDLTKGLLTSWLAMFPIFGKTLDDSVRRFLDAATEHKPEYRGVPVEILPIEILNTGLKAAPDMAQAVGELISGDKKAANIAFKRSIYDLWLSIGLVNGIPVYELNRVFKDSEDKEQGGRRRPPRRTPLERRR